MIKFLFDDVEKENTRATRLGLSVKNRKWLERGYSVGLSLIMKDKPTICSGSTMGEQIAMEAYLRAIINEWDETGILMKGADQGAFQLKAKFHLADNKIPSHFHLSSLQLKGSTITCTIATNSKMFKPFERLKFLNKERVESTILVRCEYGPYQRGGMIQIPPTSNGDRRLFTTITLMKYLTVMAVSLLWFINGTEMRSCSRTRQIEGCDAIDVSFESNMTRDYRNEEGSTDNQGQGRRVIECSFYLEYDSIRA